MGVRQSATIVFPDAIHNASGEGGDESRRKRRRKNKAR
jgi:hypothetical protein